MLHIDPGRHFVSSRFRDERNQYSTPRDYGSLGEFSPVGEFGYAQTLLDSCVFCCLRFRRNRNMMAWRNSIDGATDDSDTLSLSEERFQEWFPPR